MSVIRDLHKKPEEWRAGGVSLPSMINFEMRKGEKVACIEKALTRLDGERFRILEKHREHWELNEYLSSPGPIQFEW